MGRFASLSSRSPGPSNSISSCVIVTFPRLPFILDWAKKNVSIGTNSSRHSRNESWICVLVTSFSMPSNYDVVDCGI
ncbi:hypothetical protein PGTUg99_031038 [Puccinia graminis f. sp. tritici]|uniref:Uncharacterized protein n=1 Tax=Puccinia graminis f. sp. tritici TaxID=56615 RepID=A0A5B0SLY7_PUCGR|nr:hypothetical protein PGTUg99_031038 [Puccinia graminis f. sp. tritici]